MNSFLELHGLSISGTINTFDRVIFKGHLNGFFPDGAFGRYLSRRGILLKDAGRFFEAETQRIRDHVVSLAAAAGRPVEYLMGSSTHRSGTSKEARAWQIAERDGVTEGLVCVLSVVEPCRSFGVTPNRQTRRLEVVRRRRKCLHYYLYRIDPEFGWMHVRLQTWAPYEMQIYVNGREWLARQIDQAGIGYRRSDNKITDVDDFGPITALCGRFAHTNCHRSWSGRPPWSIRCCPTSNAPASPATGGSSISASTPATSCSPTVRRWRRSRAIW